MSYSTLQVRQEESILFIQIDRPQAGNTINAQLVAECHDVLTRCNQSASIIVLSGSSEVFCQGADFKALADASPASHARDEGPGPLYDLWLRLAQGSYVTISHVRGKTNAGGIGFLAASDIVLADETARFSLSELLFGLYPACVLPFLTRRIGFQRAHYLTLMTQPIAVKQASDWGLVDAFDTHSDALLRRHLSRLRRLSKVAIARYKGYINSIGTPLAHLKQPAVAANLEVFGDATNRQAIARYVEQGTFPWESP